MNYDQVMQLAGQYDSLIKANLLKVYVKFKLVIFDNSELQGEVNMNIEGTLLYHPSFQTTTRLFLAGLATNQSDQSTAITIQNVIQSSSILPPDWQLSLRLTKDILQDKTQALFVEYYSSGNWSGALFFTENGGSVGGIGNEDSDFLYPFAGNSLFSTYTIVFEDLQFVPVHFYRIPDLIASFISAGVTKDGGGFIIINGHIHHIPPKSPITEIIKVLALYHNKSIEDLTALFETFKTSQLIAEITPGN